MEAERDMYDGKTVNYVQWTQSIQDCFLDKWPWSSWLTSLSHILHELLLCVHTCNVFFVPWSIYTSASLHNVCFCYCCENTLKIISVFSQSRNRASMDNATTFVHSVKERIWKYLLLSFSSRWEWSMCWSTVTWKYAYHPNILFEGAENLAVSIAFVHVRLEILGWLLTSGLCHC